MAAARMVATGPTGQDATGPGDTGPPARVRRLRRVLVWALLVELLLLGLTGVYLLAFYRPSAAQAWGDIYQRSSATTLADHARDAHGLLSWIALATTLLLASVLFAEGVVRWSGPGHRRRGLVTGPLVFVGLAVTAYLGSLLPWDQVALWAVTVGTNVRGYRLFFDDDHVRFVLIGGSEVSLGTARVVLVLHVVVLPALVLGLLGLSSARGRAGRGRDHQDVVIAATEGRGAH